MNEEVNQPVMSPEEFEKECKEKGWTQAQLAKRWGFSDARRIRQIKANPSKNPHFIDAIKGLPYLLKK